MKCAVPLKINLRRDARENQSAVGKHSAETNFRPLKGEKDDVYRACKDNKCHGKFKGTASKV